MLFIDWIFYLKTEMMKKLISIWKAFQAKKKQDEVPQSKHHRPAVEERHAARSRLANEPNNSMITSLLTTQSCGDCEDHQEGDSTSNESQNQTLFCIEERFIDTNRGLRNCTA